MIDESMREALRKLGHIGGKTLLAKRGREYFREIGGHGGTRSSTRFKKGDPRTLELSKQGREASAAARRKAQSEEPTEKAAG